jgi:hypothetical protein
MVSTIKPVDLTRPEKKISDNKKAKIPEIRMLLFLLILSDRIPKRIVPIAPVTEKRLNVNPASEKLRFPILIK